jgi:hypothetical protein
MPSLLRIAHDPLHELESEGRLPRRPMSDGTNPIIDLGSSNLVHAPPTEFAHRAKRLDTALIRRRSNAQLKPFQPAVEEVGEELRLRLVESAELCLSLDLHLEASRVSLSRERPAALPASIAPADFEAAVPLPNRRHYPRQRSIASRTSE